MKLKELSALFTGTRDGVLPSSQSFPPLDINQIAQDLQVEARAADAGAKNWPPDDSDLEDSAELEIRAEIENRFRKALEDYRSQRSLYEGRIRRAHISDDLRIEIEAAGESALADFRVQVMDDQNHLHIEQQQLRAREAEFLRFQEVNGLHRLPIDVSDFRRRFGYAVLIVFWLIESIMNGLFFAKGSALGIVGGVGQALGLSALNLLGAWVFGSFGARCLINRSWALKFVGALLLVAYIAWALGLNLLIAHFRDAFVITRGQVELQDLSAGLLNAPFVLADADSWLLGTLGVALSLITAVNAWGLDDPYLGFGAVGRRRQDAIRAYASAKTECLRHLQETRDAVISDMNSVIESMKAAEYELRLAVEGRSSLYRNFQAFVDHAADSYIRLCQKYVHANVAARITTSGPSRFRQVPTRPAVLTAGVLEDLPELAKDERVTAIQRMEYFIKEINSRYQNAASLFDTVAMVTTPQK